ncbi:hypothetical protein OG592_27315 [Streptomyces avidinii]|uniref:hypothetical protein n=1 Tax=Streptomyces avidinii TaxID=1895 RepID=UPI003870C985|nr:hypothetical protein OG592_27315 [Streptomyces avidinii]
MSTLLVQIDDQTLPLSKCVWVEYRPCGCPCGVMNADWGDDMVYATEEQARREMYPLKRERDKSIKQGFALKLLTFTNYRDTVDITLRCETCSPQPEASDGR